MKGKRVTGLLLAGCMACSMLPAAAWAADTAPEDTHIEQAMRTVAAHGTCGDHANWVYYDDNSMEIIGRGAIEDTTGWDPYKDEAAKLTLDSEITAIGRDCFNGWQNLQEVDLPEGLQSIGQSAFSHCKKLKEVTIPSTVTEIGSRAFYYTTKMEKVNYLCNISRAATNWFCAAGSATDGMTVNIGPSVTVLPNRFMSGSDGTQPSANVSVLHMSDSVRTIGERAFIYCSNLKNFHMSEGIETIGEYAFWDCEGMTEITIPRSTNYIGSNALYLPNLTNFHFEAEQCEAEDDMLHGNEVKSKVTVTIGDQVQYIPKKFLKNIQLNNKSLVLPLSVREIDDAAFQHCTGLREITLSEWTSRIGSLAFEECADLNKIYFRGKAPQMAEDMFRGVLADAFYPEGNSSWNHAIRSQYGGIITWNTWRPQNVAKEPVENIFPDVQPGAWYVPYIQYVYDNNLMGGTPKGFEPNSPVTRAMVAQILYSAEDKPAVSGKSPFKDVKPNNWFHDAVLWASSNGVVGGYADKTFRPYIDVTREQLAVMLYAFEGKPQVSGSLAKFADAESVSSWAKNAMIWAVRDGIIGGIRKNGVMYLQPQGKATRAQIAVMLKQYFE